MSKTLLQTLFLPIPETMGDRRCGGAEGPWTGGRGEGEVGELGWPGVLGEAVS